MILSKPIRKRDPKYLAWIRTLPCTLITKAHGLTIEANHIREAGHGGIGTKPDDSRALPFCGLHHRIYHHFGKIKTEELYSVCLETEIKRLNALYLREHPQVKQKAKRETVAIHLKHCARCFQVVKLCKAKNKI